jgi:hypothetical protein
MKVRCVANQGKALPQSYIDSTEGYYVGMVFEELTLGKEYTVYLLTSWKGDTWYYIDDGPGRYYPSTYPAPLFEVINNRLSSSWQIEVGTDGSLTLAFAEWFEDPYFFDRLTDLEDATVEIFRQIRNRLDAEAEQP